MSLDDAIRHAKAAAKWLLPTYWLHRWICPHWVAHDCEANPIICRLEFLTRWHWGSAWGYREEDES